MNKQAPVTAPVTATALRISASGLYSGRLFYNDGANTVYLGIDSTVTATGLTKGYPLAAGKEFFDDSLNEMWAICAGGLTSSVIVFGKGI